MKQKLTTVGSGISRTMQSIRTLLQSYYHASTSPLLLFVTSNQQCQSTGC